MPKIINLESTGIRISAMLVYKSRLKYGLFAKFLLTVIRLYEVAKNPHTYLTRENQHIQEINRYFDGALNNYGPMVFALN